MSTFAKAVYAFSGEGQAVPLPLAESAVVLVVERNQEGWCRGFSGGKEGWFPVSYVKDIPESSISSSGTLPASLAAVLRSSQWKAYATAEDKIYYVNLQTQDTTWEMPSLPPSLPTPEQQPTTTNGTTTSTATTATAPSPVHNGTHTQSQLKKGSRKSVMQKSKIRQKTENGFTFTDGPSDQQLLSPGELSYIDHFWGDKGEQSGFDILLEKHMNGKYAMKDMAEFFRQRAVLEDIYAKGLLKLSKSTLGNMEEGTLGKAWQVLKAESFHRSEAHSGFSAKLLKQIEKPVIDFKESQKKERKEHQTIMERSRKQVQALNASIERAKVLLSGKLKRQSSQPDEGVSLLKRGITTGEDIKKMEEAYNQAQRQWIDNMINACTDYERHEEKRTEFLRGQWLKYIEICVAVDEASAESLSTVTDAVDRVNKKADREFFIKTKGTCTLRPVDRV